MNKETSEMLPPPAIGIPSESSPDKSEGENSETSDHEDVVITLFNRFDEGSVDRSSTMKSIPEDSIAGDSFYQKLSQEDFKVESVNESVGSVYFRVHAPVFEEDYSNEQLLGYIEQLSNTLKRTERSARKQKSRRRSREKTIMKMAKVLQDQKYTVEQLRTKIDELKSEVHMKETENSLSDQRLRNTMKDLREAETEIKTLSERPVKLHAANGALQKHISIQEPKQDHSIMTRMQQRRVLKGVAVILLCVSSLTAVCALVGCKMSNARAIEGDETCDIASALGAYRLNFASRGVETDGKKHRGKGSEHAKRKKRSLLAAYANAISESTPSSVVEHFIQGNGIQ